MSKNKLIEHLENNGMGSSSDYPHPIIFLYEVALGKRKFSDNVGGMAYEYEASDKLKVTCMVEVLKHIADDEKPKQSDVIISDLVSVIKRQIVDGGTDDTNAA